ncbi:hypothetical protein DRN84_01130 [Candidatus Geothermarchaeota archaeon]|nr:MAG: hypothetical protein DRN84_01130 [Candidatus Geothermarchaeota archaeon]
MPLSTFYTLIGKPVIEKYGRFKGRVIGFELDSENNLKNIVFENGGVILSKNISSFEIHDGYLIYLPALIKEGTNLLNEYKDLELFIETLRKMYNMNLSRKLIRIYYDKTIGRFKSLSSRLSKYIKFLERRRRKIEDQIEWLKNITFYLHIGNENGYLDSTLYKYSYDLVSSEILKFTNELEDIERISLELTTINSKIESYLKDFQEVYEENVEEKAGYT